MVLEDTNFEKDDIKNTEFKGISTKEKEILVIFVKIIFSVIIIIFTMELIRVMFL